MGRKKLCADALREREQERKETFTKRCKGLFKKAHELASMCGCEVQLCVQGEDGRLYHLHRLRHPSLSATTASTTTTSAATAPTSPTSSSSPSSPQPPPPPLPPPPSSRKRARLFYNPLTFKMEHCPTDFSSSDAPPYLLFLPSPSSSSPCPCYDCFSGRSSSSAPFLPADTPSSPPLPLQRSFLHSHHPLFLPPSPLPSPAPPPAAATVNADAVPLPSSTNALTTRPSCSSFVFSQDPLTFDATGTICLDGTNYASSLECSFSNEASSVKVEPLAIDPFCIPCDVYFPWENLEGQSYFM